MLAGDVAGERACQAKSTAEQDALIWQDLRQHAESCTAAPGTSLSYIHTRLHAHSTSVPVTPHLSAHRSDGWDGRRHGWGEESTDGWTHGRPLIYEDLQVWRAVRPRAPRASATPSIVASLWGMGSVHEAMNSPKC